MLSFIGQCTENKISRKKIFELKTVEERIGRDYANVLVSIMGNYTTLQGPGFVSHKCVNGAWNTKLTANFPFGKVIRFGVDAFVRNSIYIPYVPRNDIMEVSILVAAVGEGLLKSLSGSLSMCSMSTYGFHWWPPGLLLSHY